MRHGRFNCDHCGTNFYVSNTLHSMGLVCSCCRAPSPPPTPSPSAAPFVLGYHYSTRIAEMIEELKSNPEMNKVELEVEASNVAGWTELSPIVVVGDELSADNLQVFRSLQVQYPGGLFKDWTEKEWELGEKIAEGDQAELFEVWGLDSDGRRVEEVPWVVKMFKDGLRLHDVQKLLPHGMLWRGHFDVGHHCNMIKGAMLFNGRFAITMEQKWGDLRKLIDARLIHSKMSRPLFTYEEIRWCMHEIANGVRALHVMNITHRGLKAANVFVRSFNVWCPPSAFDPIRGWFTCEVVDYECSVGVVGTGFWRAPEILLAAKNQSVTLDVFSNAADVYSYRTTCYEIITGHLPFEVEGYIKANNYDRVIGGCRPSLPSEIPHWMEDVGRRTLGKGPPLVIY